MKFTEFRNLDIKYDEKYLTKYRDSKDRRVIKVKDRRTKLNKDGIYEVYPITITKKQIYVVCPFCHEIHIHGLIEDSDKTYGGRHPLCIGEHDNTTYYIKKNNKRK